MQALMYRREYSVCSGKDGFVLDVRDRWLPGWVAEHFVTGVLAALGHPCCGRGLGGIEKISELSYLLLVAPNKLSHHDRRLVHLSLTAEEAFALEPAYVRGHWSIESKIHWVRDVTLREDASQVRNASRFRVMATLRNLAIGLIRQAGYARIAATMRKIRNNPHLLLAILGLHQHPTGTP